MVMNGGTAARRNTELKDEKNTIDESIKKREGL